jgi:hypothetical protein
VAKIPYRIIFYSVDELTTLLRVRGFVRDENPPEPAYIYWDHKEEAKGIRVKADIFDDKGKLRIITPEQWNPKDVEAYVIPPPEAEQPAGSDDVPF